MVQDGGIINQNVVGLVDIKHGVAFDLIREGHVWVVHDEFDSGTPLICHSLVHFFVDVLQEFVTEHDSVLLLLLEVRLVGDQRRNHA